MTNKTAVLMKNRTVFGKDLFSIIAFLLYFKAACDDCKIGESAAMRLSKHYLTGLSKAVIKARVALQTEAAKSKARCSTSFSAMVNCGFNPFAMDDKNATVDVDIRNFNHSSLKSTDNALKLRTKMLRCSCA